MKAKVEEFIELIKSQPEDNWRTIFLCDHAGKHCKTGWALHMDGVEDQYLHTLGSSAPNWHPYVFNEDRQPSLADLCWGHFGFDLNTVHDLIDLNDIARSAEEATRKMEEYLHEHFNS